MTSTTAADSFCRQITAETKRSILAKLDRGRDSAAQLQFLLRSAAATEHHLLALADSIFSVFTEVISDLDSSQSAADEVACPDHSLCSDLDSGNSRRRSSVQDLARANKKRKLENRRIVTSATAEDGHAWRKYGQKAILNTTHPKSYYRCTHKYELKCEATKHVQRMEGDSDIYKITYISNHTCGPASPIAVAETPTSDSHNISFSAADSGNNRWFRPSDGNVSTMIDETDLWLNLNDYLHKAPMSNQGYFSMGDDASSFFMF